MNDKIKDLCIKEMISEEVASIIWEESRRETFIDIMNNLKEYNKKFK